MSDTAMAFILARARWIIGQQNRILAGNPVPSASLEAFRNMTTLRGKTLGLIGLGRNGSAMVPKAKGFGMNVIAHDPYVAKDVAKDL